MRDCIRWFKCKLKPPKKGVTLPSEHQDIVESLAKAMKKFKGQKPEEPLSKQKQGQPSSSSSSSHVSGKQRSVLEMYAQAAWQIVHPTQASGSQRHPPHPAPAAGRIAQKLKKPQSAAAAAAPPPVPQSHQSCTLHLSQLVLLLLVR